MKNKKILIFIIIACVICVILTLSYIDGHDARKLINAIENEDVTAVEQLLDNGIDPNRPKYKPSKLWGMLESVPESPLSIACQIGNYEIVKILIDHGATVNHIEDTGWSPLGATLLYYQPDDVKIVKLLLESGADPNYRENRTPVFNAASMTPKDFVSAKTNRPAVFSSGYDEDSAKGITEIVQLLLQYDDVDTTTVDGSELLSIAVQRENVYLVKYLLSCGCDPNSENRNGKTALDYAVESENEHLIELLSYNEHPPTESTEK